MCLADFEFLWDGSQPGWTLHRIDRVEWTIRFRFGETGASQAEIVALRKLVPELRDEPIVTVSQQLRQEHDYTFPRALGNLEVRALMEAARKAGLVATADSIDRGGYLPVDAEGHALIIEDDRLAAQVAERMIAAGVPVVEIHVD